MHIRVLGAGLAGCEAALYLAGRGYAVELWEQKPHKFSPAHKNADFAELVLDIKNLNENNMKAARNRLEQLCQKYAIPRRHFIVETRNLNALAYFTQAGFYTSYYVDFPKPSELDDEAIDTCITHLQRVADSHKVCALSFPGWWYADIHEKLHRDIDLLTWKHRTTELGMLFFPHNRRMLADEQLKVILVKSPSEYHR